MASGYILKLDKYRSSELEDSRFIDNRFSQPVPEFRFNRNLPLVCFVCNGSGLLVYLAMGRRGASAGTGLSKLNLSQLSPVSKKYYLKKYANKVENRFKKPLERKLLLGGLLTPKQFSALVDVILRDQTELAEFLRRYSSENARRVAALSRAASKQLALQKDAVSTALSIAQIDRLPLRSWTLEGDEPPASFLDGLESVRLREDQMIVNDLKKVPGFQSFESAAHGSCVFRSNTGTTLTLILANRLPLEQLTGADLIYYNETYKSFVLVQYKAMEAGGAGSSPIYRMPNRQLDAELSRMRDIRSRLGDFSLVTSKNDFRLNDDPFYLKMCARVVFKPDDISLVPGMYIPLSQWDHLTKDEDIIGPQGGKGITYENVGRYLNNTRFIDLVSMAWVGTTSSGSSVLENVIKETISSGRAAVIAVEENTTTRGKR